MASTHLKNIRQIGSFPQVGMKIKNIWNHHPAEYKKVPFPRKNPLNFSGVPIHQVETWTPFLSFHEIYQLFPRNLHWLNDLRPSSGLQLVSLGTCLALKLTKDLQTPFFLQDKTYLFFWEKKRVKNLIIHQLKLWACFLEGFIYVLNHARSVRLAEGWFIYSYTFNIGSNSRI